MTSSGGQSSIAVKKKYLLWLMPKPYPKLTDDDSGLEVTRIKEWQKFLQAMYFGRMYYWTQDGLLVTPVRLDTYTKEVAPGNWVEDFSESTGDDLSGTDWYEENINDADYGGYTRNLKSKKIIRPAPSGPLNLAEDFRPTNKRKPFEAVNWTVPSCMIWMDKLKKWW